jgi:hypothetical protein
VGILLHNDCLESSLKQVPYPTVALIESLGIDAVQLPHAYRKISVGRINKQMVMIVHQAVGMADPVVSMGNIRKGIQEDLSVLVVSENCLSLISSASDVIDSSWKFYTQWTCHGYPIAK